MGRTYDQGRRDTSPPVDEMPADGSARAGRMVRAARKHRGAPVLAAPPQGSRTGAVATRPPWDEAGRGGMPPCGTKPPWRLAAPVSHSAAPSQLSALSWCRFSAHPRDPPPGERGDPPWVEEFREEPPRRLWLTY